MNPEVRACGLDEAIGDTAQRHENRAFIHDSEVVLMS
jgi:hypothetical protein